MSVIAAKLYDNRIDFAADSITLRGDLKQTNGPAKLVAINGMVIGGCGLCEEISMMFRFAQTHHPETPTCRDVLAFFTEFLKWKPNGSCLKGSTDFLIGFKGHLFLIEDMYVSEIKDFVAIGAGRDYSLAALYLGHDPRDAVKVACDLSCFVSEPIVFISMDAFGIHGATDTWES